MIVTGEAKKAKVRSVPNDPEETNSPDDKRDGRQSMSSKPATDTIEKVGVEENDNNSDAIDPAELLEDNPLALPTRLDETDHTYSRHTSKSKECSKKENRGEGKQKRHTPKKTKEKTKSVKNQRNVMEKGVDEHIWDDMDDFDMTNLKDKVMQEGDQKIGRDCQQDDKENKGRMVGTTDCEETCQTMKYRHLRLKRARARMGKLCSNHPSTRLTSYLVGFMGAQPIMKH